MVMAEIPVVHTFVNGTFRQTNLSNESDDYLDKREELRVAEIDLMRQRERVAALRRALPAGAQLQDYEFLEGPTNLQADDAPLRQVRLSELFTTPNRPLIIYHLMFGKKQTKPCPLCTMWIDGYNGVARHLAPNIDFAIVAAAESKTLRDFARQRGWHDLRLLSAAANTFKRDLGSEDAQGGQDSAVSVFTKHVDGAVHHPYTAHPRLAPELGQRGIDLLTPVWNLLDLTPQGPQQWYPSLAYGKS
jgi:predicted dithiol-disulfide oxidoreductase (DUF899 family)